VGWSRLDSITLRQLRAFCTVVRLLSYTRAAEELGCQQPTVSALVAELERATQLTLLEQWGKQLSLTDEGRELYAHAQQVIVTADETKQAMEELRGIALAERQPLRIAADTTVGTYVLPHLLSAFHKQEPGIALNLRVANRAGVRASLFGGEVDLVIAGRPPVVDGLLADPFLENPLVVVADPEHELCGKARIPLARLSDEIFLLREVGSGTRAAVEDLFEVAGLPLKVGMTLGHIEAIKQAVAAGLGVSVFSEVAIQREIRSGRLVVLDVEQFPIQRRWYIARLAQRPLLSSVATFLAFLRDYKTKRFSR